MGTVSSVKGRREADERLPRERRKKEGVEEAEPRRENFLEMREVAGEALGEGEVVSEEVEDRRDSRRLAEEDFPRGRLEFGLWRE